MRKKQIEKKKCCISLSERDIELLDFMRLQDDKTRSAYLSELIQKQAKRTKTDQIITKGGAIILWFGKKEKSHRPPKSQVRPYFSQDKYNRWATKKQAQKT